VLVCVTAGRLWLINLKRCPLRFGSRMLAFAALVRLSQVSPALPQETLSQRIQP